MTTPAIEPAFGVAEWPEYSDDNLPADILQRLLTAAEEVDAELRDASRQSGATTFEVDLGEDWKLP